MRAVVVYESLFGNTHAVAEAIAEGIRARAEVDVLAVADASADAVAGAELLVVGGPTHAHGMASSLTYRAAKGQGEHELDEAATGPSLRSWFHHLPGGDGTRAAAFDTRLPGSTLKTGSASKGIERRLRHHGYQLDGSASFVVEVADGNLRKGELERARSWGAELAEHL